MMSLSLLYYVLKNRSRIMSRISPAPRVFAKSGAKVRRLSEPTKFFSDFFEKNFLEGFTPIYIKAAALPRHTRPRGLWAAMEIAA